MITDLFHSRLRRGFRFAAYGAAAGVAAVSAVYALGSVLAALLGMPLPHATFFEEAVAVLTAVVQGIAVLAAVGFLIGATTVYPMERAIAKQLLGVVIGVAAVLFGAWILRLWLEGETSLVGLLIGVFIAVAGIGAGLIVTREAHTA